MRLPLTFFSQRSIGDLSNRAHAHSEIRDVVRTLSTTLIDVCLVCSYLLLVLAYNSGLGGIVIGLTALRLSLVILLQRLVSDAVANEVVASARESAMLAEAFASPEAVRGLALEQHVHQRYLDCATDK